MHMLHTASTSHWLCAFFKIMFPIELECVRAWANSSWYACVRGTQLMESLHVQGDVGCGKTAVAFLALLAAAGSGYQAAIMLPTEILASQTHAKLQQLLQSMPEGLQPKLEILTGGTKAKERREVCFLAAKS